MVFFKAEIEDLRNFNILIDGFEIIRMYLIKRF